MKAACTFRETSVGYIRSEIKRLKSEMKRPSTPKRMFPRGLKTVAKGSTEYNPLEITQHQKDLLRGKKVKLLAGFEEKTYIDKDGKVVTIKVDTREPKLKSW